MVEFFSEYLWYTIMIRNENLSENTWLLIHLQLVFPFVIIDNMKME